MSLESHRPHLFLDFDGVLHPTSASPDDLFVHAYALSALLHGSTCCVVISSSWRHHHPMEALLDRLPNGLRQRVTGATGDAYIGRWARHREILAYVARFRISAPWRALDDSWNEFPPQCPELIACNPNTGLGAKEEMLLQVWLRAAESP
jgi:hypothetical protein